MIHARIGLTAVLLLCCTRALALDCSNAMTTADMIQCAYQSQQRVEKKLNATYKATLAQLDRNRATAVKAKLIKAQRAWIQFREADCDAAFEMYFPGTMSTQIRIGCMEERAEQRIRELEQLAGINR